MLGFIDEATLAWVAEKKGLSVQSAGIVVSEKLVAGKKTQRHINDENALSDAELLALPRLLADQPVTSYWSNNTLILATDAIEDNRKIKVVVNIDYMDKKVSKGKFNSVRTFFKVDEADLGNKGRYEKIR